MTKISIVMPVYNNEKYLPMAVESVEQQNYDNYELIIIDDGSTDKTPQVVDTLAEKNSHVKVIHQKNQWIYNSFNNGIALATGEYVYILNSDDRLMPGVFELFDRKIQKYHPDVIWTKVLAHECDEEQNIIHYDKFHVEESIKKESFYFQKSDVEKAWVYFYSSGVIGNQANLYRREIMQKHLFRNDVYAADEFYNISIADEIHSALVLKEPVYSHFIYNCDVMNASIGKYYSYEHDMHNEKYEKYNALFQKWGLPLEDYIMILSQRRLSSLSHELKGLQAKNCPLSIEEKLQFAFCDCIDEIIKKCVMESDSREELESRILSGARVLLLNESINSKSKMYFVYELLESLLRYEKDEKDYRKIENAINHPLNPFHIGRCFYEKLRDG